MNLTQCVIIHESTVIVQFWQIYTRVDIVKPSPLSQYWCIYLKNWYQQTNIEQYTPTSLYQQNYTNELILMNVCLWVNINKSMLKSPHRCFFTNVSMLMNLNLWVNIDESALTCRYSWICSFKVTLINLHLQVNINESRPMGQY